MLRYLTAPLLIFQALCSLEPGDPLPIEASIRMGEFANGVRYYIRPTQEEESVSNGRVSMRLVVPVGSVLEEEHERGVAHFVEHLLFHGTESFSDLGIKAFLRSIGASIGADVNASTGTDETIFTLEVPHGERQQVAMALHLLSEWASCASLTDHAIEQERGIILEEWRRQLGPNLRVMEAAYQSLMRGSRYAERLPIGLEEVIRDVDGETIRQFYHRWYRSVPIAVIVAGNVDPDWAEEEIRDRFEGLDRDYEGCGLPHFGIELGGKSEFALTRDPELSVSSVELMFKELSMPMETVGDLHRELRCQLFHQLLEARLLELRELPDSSLSSAGSRCSRINRPLLAHTFEGRCRADQVATALMQLALELKRVKKGGFTQTEFQRIVAERRKELRLGSMRKSSRMLADRCVGHFLNGDPLCGEAFIIQAWQEFLQSVTPAEVAEVAENWTLLEDCVIHVSNPDTPDVPEVNRDLMVRILDWIDHSELPDYVDMHAGEELLETLPEPGRVSGVRRCLTYPSPLIFELENGMHVWVVPNSSSDSSIVLAGVALGGISSLEGDQAVSGRLAGALLNESGIGGHTPAELRKLLGGQQAHLVRDVCLYRREFIGRSYAEDLEALFQLVHLAFTHQVNDPNLFEKIKQRVETQLITEERNPGGLLSRTVEGLNWDDHPYFTFPTWADLETLDFAQADQVALESFRSPEEFTVVLVGDMDLEEVAGLVERYLASIPSHPPLYDGWEPLRAQFTEGVCKEIVHRGISPKGVVRITFPMALSSPTPVQQELVQLARQVIGSSVHDVLRTRLSGTYHVDVWTRWYPPDNDTATFCVEFACDPEDAELLSQVALRELRLLKERGPVSAQVEELIQTAWRRQIRSREDNTFWAHEAVMAVLHDWGVDALGLVRNRFEEVSEEGVRHQIEQMLPLDNYSVVILLPSEEIDN